jgi:hypothetical protein
MEDNSLLVLFIGYCVLIYLSYLRQGWRQSALSVLAASIWLAHLPPSNSIVKYFYLFVLLLSYFATQMSDSKKLRADLVVFTYLASCLIWLIWISGLGPSEFDALYKVLVLAPMSFIVGYQALRSGKTPGFLRAFMNQGIFFSGLAILEQFTGRNWIPQRTNEFVYINPEGRIRLFTEHPLVLAVMFTLVSHLILSSTMNTWNKRLAVLLVFLGSITTQTISAPILIILLGLLTYISKTFRVSLRLNFLIMRLFVATFFFVTLLASATLNPFSPLLSVPGDIASALYRLVIYGLMWVILANYPLGFGALSLPEGLYSIPSVYGDLSLTSLDSELVYSVAQFGYFGFIPYVLIFAALYFLRTSSQSRTAMVVMLFSSLFASMHSWISLSILFFFVLGSSVRTRTVENEALKSISNKQVPK